VAGKHRQHLPAHLLGPGLVAQDPGEAVELAVPHGHADLVQRLHGDRVLGGHDPLFQAVLDGLDEAVRVAGLVVHGVDDLGHVEGQTVVGQPREDDGVADAAVREELDGLLRRHFPFFRHQQHQARQLVVFPAPVDRLPHERHREPLHGLVLRLGRSGSGSSAAVGGVVVGAHSFLCRAMCGCAIDRSRAGV